MNKCPECGSNDGTSVGSGFFCRICKKQYPGKYEDGICATCGKNCVTFFNINFEKRYICEGCANSITIQQITFLMRGAEQ